VSADPSAAPGIAVSVVVPAHNAAATIGGTLEALSAQDLQAPYEVIVVDDGSSDDTASVVERVRAAHGRIRLISTTRHGAAHTRNTGVRSANSSLLAFTDADCFPTAGWLAAGLRALDDEIDLLQGAVAPYPHARRNPFERTLYVERESGLYETANLFVRREVFDRVGGFEPMFPDRARVAPGEDVLFGWRARRAGARTGFCAHALVHHAVFSGGLRSYLTEGRRVGYFADVVRRVPELREHFLYRRLFLSERQARFDLAVAAVMAARWRRSGVPLAAAIPYTITLGQLAVAWRRWAPLVLIFGLLRDAISFGSLVAHSLAQRTVVL